MAIHASSSSIKNDNNTIMFSEIKTYVKMIFEMISNSF